MSELFGHKAALRGQKPPGRQVLSLKLLHERTIFQVGIPVKKKRKPSGRGISDLTLQIVDQVDVEEVAFPLSMTGGWRDQVRSLNCVTARQRP